MSDDESRGRHLPPLEKLRRSGKLELLWLVTILSSLGREQISPLVDMSYKASFRRPERSFNTKGESLKSSLIAGGPQIYLRGHFIKFRMHIQRFLIFRHLIKAFRKLQKQIQPISIFLIIFFSFLILMFEKIKKM